MMQLTNKYDLEIMNFLAGATLFGYENIKRHANNKTNNNNLANNSDQGWINIHKDLFSSQPKVKSVAEIAPFNIITESLYSSMGKINAAQNAANVICDKAKQAWDQYSTSLDENFRAIFKEYIFNLQFTVNFQ